MKIPAIKKFLIMSISILLFFINVTIPVSALEKKSYNSKPEIKTNIIISDPETGEKWKWDVSKSDISEASLTPSTSEISDFRSNSKDKDDKLNKAVVSVSIGDYLRRTFKNNTIKPRLDQSSSKYDDIKLSIGLTYTQNASTNKVRIFNVFGSTTAVGLYYPTDRRVSWRNPNADVGGVLTPSSNSWNYSTNSTAGAYTSQLPPKAILDCKARISGMTAYRNVTVSCTL